MNKFKAILLCYGKVALTMNFELKYKAVNYTTWMIEGIETREELFVGKALLSTAHRTRRGTYRRIGRAEAD